MIQENDVFEIPEEIRRMSLEEIEVELRKMDRLLGKDKIDRNYCELSLPIKV